MRGFSHFGFLGAMLCVPLFAADAPTQSVVLDNIAAIRNLPPDEASKKLPVAVEAVVTYYDAKGKMLLVRDATGGIFIDPLKPYPIVAGSVIKVSGVTLGDFTNMIVEPVITEVTRGSRPVPKKIALQSLLSGDADCEYVTVTGMVRTAFFAMEVGIRRLQLRLEVEGKSVDVDVLEYDSSTNPDALIGSTVSIEGVAVGTFNDRKQLENVVVDVQNIRDVKTIRQAPESPYLLPIRAIDEIAKYRDGTRFGIRAHLRGVVTFIRPRRFVVLQDDEKGITVYTQQTTPLRVGDQVDVTGFPVFGESSPVLEDANYRLIAAGKRAPGKVQARSMKPTNSQASFFDSQLVFTEGKVLTISRTPGKYTLVLSSGEVLFSAVLESANRVAEIEKLREGSFVRVTGVCSVETAGMWHMILEFRILMRSGQDILVLQAAPWWDIRRLFYLLGALVIAVIATIAWVAVLRNRVAWQSLEMQKVQLAEAAREKKFGELQEIRNRILEGINRREPLPGTLKAIASLPEQQFPGLTCLLHLIDAHGVLNSIEGTSFNSDGACTRLQTHVVRSGKPLSEGEGWCWPVFSSNNEVVGTVTVIHRDSVPVAVLISLLEITTKLAALAIDNRALYDGLQHQSQHDPLTGLPNRLYLDNQLKFAIESARLSGKRLAITYIDLDKFKQVNDVYGHEAGDLFLQCVAQRFRACLRERDMLGRVGGDEFVGFFPEIHDRGEAEDIGRRIVASLREPLSLAPNQSLYASASIGISVFPDDGDTLEQLRRHADDAMYAEKLKQDARVDPSDAADDGGVSVSELRLALASHRFRLHYQPIFSMEGELYGFEALIRMVAQSGELLPPAKFIDAAENSGLIVPMGRWVLREACRQAAAWMRDTGRPLTISVNVSARQFAEPHFADEVLTILGDTQLLPSMLLLELTESAVLQNVDEAIAQMHQLRRVGTRIALDDFGTGQSSLAVLQRLPIDLLKIDRSFVLSMSGLAASGGLLHSIFSLASSVGAQTIAEGVESGHQIDGLTQLGCTAAQGFGFARPIPGEAISVELRKWLGFVPDLKSRLVRPTPVIRAINEDTVVSAS